MKQDELEAYRPDMRQTLEHGFCLVSQALLAAGDTSGWPRVLASLQAYLDTTWDTQETQDKAMADNLTFLLTRQYKDAKIIVWAAGSCHANRVEGVRFTPTTSGEGYFRRRGAWQMGAPLPQILYQQAGYGGKGEEQQGQAVGFAALRRSLVGVSGRRIRGE